MAGKTLSELIPVRVHRIAWVRFFLHPHFYQNAKSLSQTAFLDDAPQSDVAHPRAAFLFPPGPRNDAYAFLRFVRHSKSTHPELSLSELTGGSFSSKAEAASVSLFARFLAAFPPQSAAGNCEQSLALGVSCF